MSGRPTVLVTGAAGALGTATVRMFLANDFDVIGVDRADATQSAASHDGYIPLRADLEAPDVTSTIARTLAGVDLRHVIGVAGGALPGEPGSKDDPDLLELDLLRASLEANLVTQFALLRAVWPALQYGSGDRSVTFTSSFNALSAQGMPAYSAAKAGLIGLMHGLVEPLGRRGIRINVLAPGTIRTPRTERLWGGVEGHFERLEAGTALGRLGTPDDVASSFLAIAVHMTHMTGQVVVTDGGQSVVHR